MNKVCSKCNIEQPISSFHKKKSGLFGVKAECKTCCAEWQQKHYNIPSVKEKRLKRQSSDSYQLYIRKFRLQQLYGISLDQYESMLKEQNYVCAICGTDKPGGRSAKYFHVDHDHNTGKVRQLLCSRCNTVLGHANDDPNILQRMIEYIKKHK